MRAAGLPALDAIRTATAWAARLLDLQQMVGRLARGFAGDVIVVDGDPLANVSVPRTPLHVVRAGLPVQGLSGRAPPARSRG